MHRIRERLRSGSGVASEASVVVVGHMVSDQPSWFLEVAALVACWATFKPAFQAVTFLVAFDLAAYGHTFVAEEVGHPSGP